MDIFLGKNGKREGERDLASQHTEQASNGSLNSHERKTTFP